VGVAGVIGCWFGLLGLVAEGILEAFALRRGPNTRSRVGDSRHSIFAFLVNANGLVMTGARDVMESGHVLGTSEVLYTGFQSKFEGICSYRHIVVGVSSGAWFIMMALGRSLARDKLFAVLITTGLILEAGGQVVLLNSWAFTIEAGLDGVGRWGWRSQGVSSLLESVTNTEGGRAFHCHGGLQGHFEVSFDHGLELCEAASLTERELVLGTRKVNYVVMNYTEVGPFSLF